MKTGDAILAVARTQIGYREGKNKNNKYGQWFGMNNCAWCVIFSAAWCYAMAGVVGDVVGRRYKNPPPPEGDGKYDGGLYSCSQTLNWYKAHAPECIVKDPIPGCLVIFDLPKTSSETDHMGLFVAKTDKTITTIDGNTSNTSEGNGGWVQERTRYFRDLVKVTYIVPKELREEEVIIEPRYNTLEEIAEKLPWAVPTISKLINMGALRGDGAGLNLTEDMIRLLVISDRAGAYHEE